MREREAEGLDEAHGASAGRGEDATPLDVSSDAVGVERGGRRGGERLRDGGGGHTDGLEGAHGVVVERRGHLRAARATVHVLDDDVAEEFGVIRGGAHRDSAAHGVPDQDEGSGRARAVRDGERDDVVGEGGGAVFVLGAGGGVSVAAEVHGEEGGGGGGLGGDARHHAVPRPAEALEAVDENHKGRGGRAGRATGLEHVAHGTRAARDAGQRRGGRDRDRGRHARARVKPDRLVVQGAPVPGDISYLRISRRAGAEFVNLSSSKLVVVLGSVQTRARGPAMGGREALRAVARADLNQLVGGLALLEQEGARSRPVSASALALESCGRTFWVGCESGEVVRCRVAQGADAAGEVWTRVSVEDMTLVVDARTATTRPSSAPPDATGHPPAARPNRDQDASARAGTLEVRQLAPLPTLACAAALTDAAGVTLHAHRDVFAIPGTARADAIAADALGAHPTQIVVSNRDVKRLTVFDVALAASEKRPTLVATPVRTVVLGIAHPALELARFGDDVVAGTPRGYARANLVDGFAEALAPMRRDATFVDDARARRVARRLEIRRPTKEPYDSMFRDGFEADGHERDDEFERDEENREDARSEDARSEDARSSRVPTLVALDEGADRKANRDADYCSSARVAVVSRARCVALDLDANFVANGTGTSAPLAPVGGVSSLAYASPYLVVVPSDPREPLRAHDLARRPGTTPGATRGDPSQTFPAPGREDVVAATRPGNTLSVTGKTDRGDVRDPRDHRGPPSPSPRTFAAGAPRGPSLSGSNSPPGASTLVVARGGFVEVRRAATVEEQVVRLLREGAWAEAVALADAEPHAEATLVLDEDENAGDGNAHGSDRASRLLPDVARATAGFLAVSSLDFAAAARYFSDSAAVEPAELLPYFERREDADATAFGGAVRSEHLRGVPVRRRWGVHAPPSTHVETVVAEGIVASRTKTRFGDGKVSESDAKTLCLAAKTHLASYLASRAIRPSDPHGRRLDTALCVLWAETSAAGALESALASDTTRDVDRDVVARVATREGRHHAFAVSASATRAHETAMERWRHLATGVVEESPSSDGGGAARRRGCAVAAAVDAAATHLRTLFAEVGGLDDPTRVDALARRHVPWILARDLDAGLSALAGPRAQRAMRLRDAMALVEPHGAAATARALAARCAPRMPGRRDPAAHVELALALVAAGDPKATFAFLSREPRLYDPARTLAAMDPARVTSSDLRDGLNRGLVHGARVADGDVDAFAPWVDCLAVAHALLDDHLAAIRLFLEVAADRPSRRRVREHCVAWGEDASNAAFRVLLWRGVPADFDAARALVEDPDVPVDVDVARAAIRDDARGEARDAFEAALDRRGENNRRGEDDEAAFGDVEDGLQSLESGSPESVAVVRSPSR